MRTRLPVVLAVAAVAIAADAQTAAPVQLQAALPGTPTGARPAPPCNCEPVNPNASPEARALLKTLCAISGKGILSGQHNYPNQRKLDTEKVFGITGKYPAFWGSDFGFTGGEDQDSIFHRDLIGRAGESSRGSVQAKLTDDQWQEPITPDTPLHQRWEKYIDTAAVYLKQLRNAHIPVLWRPMHENSGSFFWCGRRPGPGGTAHYYHELLDLADDKSIALGVVGHPRSAETLNRQVDALKSAYSDAYVINRGDPLPGN